MYSAGFVMLVGSVVSLDFAAIGPIIGVFAVSQVSGILAVLRPRESGCARESSCWGLRLW